MALPQIRGTAEGSFTSTFSGQCKEKKGVNEKPPATEKSLDGNSLISDGSHRFDTKNPNRISGSYTQKGIVGMEKTISWKLQRCGSPLMITEVELFQPIHPSYNNWTKIQKGNYTIDGNFVKIVAKIINLSGETKNTPIEFRELKENVLLPEGKMPITIEANEEKKIVYMWDTSGYAWKESGDLNEAEINRQIQVKITDDSKTENVEVRPKPVIIIPGLWTDKYSFSEFMKYFENQKSAHWSVDYARVVTGKSAAENAPEVEKRIKEMQEKTNAWHVDLVGHSTGGLTGRVYINNLMGQMADGKPTVTNFVMVGTPNKGTPCSLGLDNIITRFFIGTGVKLKPNQSTEIEIPVSEGNRMAINILAPKNVSATLLDSNGTIAGKNLAGTPEANQTFRLISVDKAFQKGTWKLKLESKETEEAEIAVVVFIF